MNSNFFQKRTTSTNPGSSSFVNDENRHKGRPQTSTHQNANMKNTFKPPANTTREFGRDLTNIMRVDGQNKPRYFPFNNQAKIFNYPKQVKKEENKKGMKSENSLYNLRPRANIQLKTNSSNNSFSHTNENVNPNVIHTAQNVTHENFDSNQMLIDTDLVTEYSESISHCDLQNKENIIQINPQIAKDYLQEIYSNLRESEGKFQLTTLDYMKYQRDINEKMRAILIDWLVDVHLKFKLTPETLFLTIQIIDRFLSKREVTRNKLQLVGVSALFITCKYEEIYPPELKDFVYVTDKAYTKKEILKMEKVILNELAFDITYPTSLRFLEIYFEVSGLKFDENIVLFSKYLLELFAVEYKSTNFLPSNIAASAFYLTLKIKRSLLPEEYHSFDVSQLSGHSEYLLKECAQYMVVVLEAADSSSLQAVRTKYSSSKFLEIAKMR